MEILVSRFSIKKAFWLLTIQLSLACIYFSACRSRPTADEIAITHTVQQFFQVLAERDILLAKKILLPEVHIYSIRENGDRSTLRSMNRADFIQQIGIGTDTLLERIWEPTIQIDGRIGVFTAPYDFYVNGRFSHCGFDVFNLMKTDEGWKIAGCVYSVIKKDCSPSPLGPPETQRLKK
jgi:hypothetical protein